MTLPRYTKQIIQVFIMESLMAGISVNGGVLVSNFSVCLEFFLIKEIMGKWPFASSH